MPFDTYKCYLSLKNHFTKDSYDYHKYCGKSRATVQSFYKRKDRFWFEKFSRSKTDAEVVEFFVSNFISCTDPGRLWIGEMMKEGDVRYTEWKKRTQSLSYIFKEEIEQLRNQYFGRIELFYFLTKEYRDVELFNGRFSKEKLEIIDKQNETQRKNRNELIRVALVGYTNVGKSTIMNMLSKSEVFAENKLFATLDTTVRKVVIANLPFLSSNKTKYNPFDNFSTLNDSAFLKIPLTPSLTLSLAISML